MRSTIVYAHPWENSFNHAVLDKCKETLSARGDTVTVIDLYADGFNPVMSKEDLRLYSQGASNDPLVAKYNEILDQTEKIIFIYPIWWYDMPAIMRGFLDKVLLVGSSYVEDQGLKPVRNIQHTTVLTTASTPTEGLVQDFGDPINGTMIDGTFKCVGFFNAKWYNLGAIEGTSQSEREAYLASIPDKI